MQIERSAEKLRICNDNHDDGDDYDSDDHGDGGGEVVNEIEWVWEAGLERHEQWLQRRHRWHDQKLSAWTAAVPIRDRSLWTFVVDCIEICYLLKNDKWNAGGVWNFLTHSTNRERAHKLNTVVIATGVVVAVAAADIADTTADTVVALTPLDLIWMFLLLIRFPFLFLLLHSRFLSHTLALAVVVSASVRITHILFLRLHHNIRVFVRDKKFIMRQKTNGIYWQHSRVIFWLRTHTHTPRLHFLIYTRWKW